MYADRFDAAHGVKPGSLGLAVAINGAVLAALIFAGSETFERTPTDPPLTLIDVAPPAPPPSPEPLPRTEPETHQQPRPSPPIDAPRPEVAVSRPATWAVATEPPPVPGTLDGLPGGAGTGGVALDPVPAATPAPVIVGPAFDPRYADALQPPYPAAERRAEREGVVVLRVLVGTDGRVRQVERISATSDAFWRATEAQALRRWRFRPGTRDGVAVEAWRQLSLRFEMAD